MTEKYVIEKNFKLPPRKSTPKYPFSEMEVGDSFAFGDDEYWNVACAAYSWGKGHNRKFGVSSVVKRCWRKS